jgi:ABC-type phosphate transport system substrate-binding protein
VEAQISIVVANSSPQAKAKDDNANAEVKKLLKAIFEAEKLKWPNGDKVQIADQPKTEISKAFYEKFIGKSAKKVRMKWMKLVLSGQANAPTKCKNDAAVKEAVSKNPNTVGYISTESLDDSVKEILRLESADLAKGK